MLKKLMVFTFFVFSCNGCLFAMDDSVVRLMSMFTNNSSEPSNVLMGDSRTITEPKDAAGNIVIKTYKVHSELIETQKIKPNGRRITEISNLETLTQRIVKSSDGSKEVTMYDEHMNSTTQKFDRNGNLIE